MMVVGAVPPSWLGCEMPCSCDNRASLCGVSLHGLPSRPDRRHWVPAQNGRELQQLDDVEPPLQAFDFGNVGLRLAKPVRDYLLRQPSRIPRCNEALN